jgi:hypothetical protein
MPLFQVLITLPATVDSSDVDGLVRTLELPEGSHVVVNEATSTDYYAPKGGGTPEQGQPSGVSSLIPTPAAPAG